MFRIRRVSDMTATMNRMMLERFQGMMKGQFPDESEKARSEVPFKLQDPMHYHYRTIVFIAEEDEEPVGAAMLLHFPDLMFCFLDHVFVSPGMTGRGIGGALYERVRVEAKALQCKGILMEVLQETPEASPDPEIRKQNLSRLRFYERYGVTPVIGTKYETPYYPGQGNPPYLLYDDLWMGKTLRMDDARAMVRAILERKYGDLVSKDYIEKVVNSFNDDPVKTRDLLYIRKVPERPLTSGLPKECLIPWAITDRHEIHHIRERGYVESPVRIESIVHGLETTGIFDKVPIKHFSERYIEAVHDRRYITFFKNVCKEVAPGKSVYPYVFPLRHEAEPPKDVLVGAGYYCIDTFTPLNRHAFISAKRAVDCALTAAHRILKGHMISYALVRPPGHHAGNRYFGGFCYFNSNAAAAQELSRHGTVAILDVDYHHGNGQQDIFYERPDVLTVSIHGHPSFAYPYFSGFAEEKGEGEGWGYNINYPLAENIDGELYKRALVKAIRKIDAFKPDYLIVALGLDTAKGDPTGTWSLSASDFELNGRIIGSLRRPTLVVQEGGYRTRILGSNARSFFKGLFEENQTLLCPFG